MNESTAKNTIIQNCEAFIEKIKDITSAKVITSSKGKISEIRVISNSKRDPREIVRDIESALIASLGSHADGKTNVAKTKDDANNIDQMKLKVDSIGIKKHKNNFFKANVCLRDLGNNTYEGIASEMVSSHGRLRIVAQATLNAISKYLKDTTMLSLGDVFIFDICNQKAVTAMIYKICEGKEEPYLGSAIIEQDIYDAVVAAVLDCFKEKITFS